LKFNIFIIYYKIFHLTTEYITWKSMHFPNFLVSMTDNQLVTLREIAKREYDPRPYCNFNFTICPNQKVSEYY